MECAWSALRWTCSPVLCDSAESRSELCRWLPVNPLSIMFILNFEKLLPSYTFLLFLQQLFLTKSRKCPLLLPWVVYFPKEKNNRYSNFSTPTVSFLIVFSSLVCRPFFFFTGTAPVPPLLAESNASVWFLLRFALIEPHTANSELSLKIWKTAKMLEKITKLQLWKIRNAKIKREEEACVFFHVPFYRVLN